MSGFFRPSEECLRNCESSVSQERRPTLTKPTREEIHMRLRPALTTMAVLAAVCGIVGYSVSALSADHFDSPATTAAPPADITDVFTWMDGNNVVLAMTMYPAAPAGALFSDNLQYVFHTASGGAFGTTTSNVDVIATFDASQKISLWVGNNEYVTGDATPAAGLTSTDQKVKVFAGLRADAFFFNLDGFKAVAGKVTNAAKAGAFSFDDAGCPLLDRSTSAALLTQLATSSDGGAPVDFFAPSNALAIVVSIDKSLLTAGGRLVTVWGATYTTGAAIGAGGQ